ncbi:MAG TPA: hypothetical protein VM913_02685 [Sphingomicrobium sp.]|jgi:hypothetical protein|nr:hypothetical protein [Sphingomicrobium sp.]
MMNVSTLGRHLSVLLLASAALSGTAHAAGQGNLGATSTGTVTINASVPQQVRISGLSDVNFINADPNLEAANAQNVCVWSNNANRRYNIVASGSGTSGAFTIGSGTLPAIPYSVEWDDVSGATTGTALATGAALGGQTSAATKSLCQDLTAESASLIVRIASADLQDMQASAAYTGTLTLTVAPE